MLICFTDEELGDDDSVGRYDSERDLENVESNLKFFGEI